MAGNYPATLRCWCDRNIPYTCVSSTER